MADSSGRLGASDLNRCLVDALEEKDEVPFSYPKPVFEGFSSTLGDKEELRIHSKQAWEKAFMKYEWAREWREILDRCVNKIAYTADQKSLIDREISEGGPKKKF